MSIENSVLADWFETWFNSHYYHILYKNRDYDEAARFIETLSRYLDFPSKSKVLDLACGKGRHSLKLKQLGFDVIGIDLAQESIQEAKQLETEEIEFYVHDMRSLYWVEHFDLVVNLFTSFGYFHNSTDDQKTISSVAGALKLKGMFVLDFLNAEKVKRKLVRSEQKRIDNVSFDIERRVEDNVIKKFIHLVDGDVELDFEEQVDALCLEDFKVYFENAGLEIQDVFGNYSLDKFDVENSDRLILIAKKVVE